jgi:hypothetical protein
VGKVDLKRTVVFRDDTGWENFLGRVSPLWLESSSEPVVFFSVFT